MSGLFDAALITAAGLYGDRGSGPYRFGALDERSDISLVFPTPSSQPLRHTSRLTLLRVPDASGLGGYAAAGAL